MTRFLLENIDWLTCDLGEYQDEFIIVDCPGQIELYTHSSIMPQIIKQFQNADYKTCGIYLLESLFLQDISKYFSGVLTAASAMLQLGIPHINVLSKMDLLTPANNNNADADENENEDDGDDDDGDDDDGDDAQYEKYDRFLTVDPTLLHSMSTHNPKHQRLTEALVNLIDEMGMVSFVPFDIRKQSHMERIMLLIENVTQFGESLEPKEPEDHDYDPEENLF